MLRTTGQKGLTRRLSSYEAVPGNCFHRPATLQDTILAFNHVSPQIFTKSSNAFRQHRNRFRLHTRSAKRSQLRLAKLELRWANFCTYLSYSKLCGTTHLYLRLDKREYPLRATLKLVEGVTQTPLCDGRGLKHTLERQVFELAKLQLGDIHFKQGFIPVAVDRLGLAQAVAGISKKIVFGDLMVALGIPIPVYGIPAFKRVARVMLPFVSWFPMNMLYYGCDGAEQEPKYVKYFETSDLIAGDFLFMRKYMPERMEGKTVVTNTTTEENIELLKARGVKTVITTTPRYEGRSFGTNMMEAALTAYAREGQTVER